MKDFTFTKKLVCMELYTVTAETEEEARQKVDNGDCRYEFIYPHEILQDQSELVLEAVEEQELSWWEKEKEKEKETPQNGQA